MKTNLFLISLLILALFSTVASANPIVEHVGISKTRIDLNNTTTVPEILGEVTIHPSTAGQVIVHFDGQCISTPGDRIGLAASNSISWSPNDGNVHAEAVNSDINGKSFSHTRVYNVNAGGGYNTYSWNTGSTPQTITVSEMTVEDDIYTVTVSNDYGCENSDSITITFSSTGMKDFQTSNMISIYPNPARDHITVKSEKVVLNGYIIKIWDVSGKILHIQQSSLI